MSLTTTDKNDIKLIIQEGQKDTNTRLDRLEVLVVENKVRVNELTVINKNIDTRVKDINTRVENIDTRLFGNEVIMEDTNATVKHMIEMLSDNLKVKSQVDNHEVRLTDVETKQPMIISTLAMHSKQLKTQ